MLASSGSYLFTWFFLSMIVEAEMVDVVGSECKEDLKFLPSISFHAASTNQSWVQQHAFQVHKVFERLHAGVYQRG